MGSEGICNFLKKVHYIYLSISQALMQKNEAFAIFDESKMRESALSKLPLCLGQTRNDKY